MYLRKVRNRFGNVSIQVVKKVSGKRTIVSHLGTAKNDLEKFELLKRGRDYIDRDRIKSGVISLFDNRFESNELTEITNKLIFGPVYDTPSFLFFEYYYNLLGLKNLKDDLFKDLCLARILHPASKMETRDYLEEKFGKVYSLTQIYRGMLKAYDKNYREKIEKILFDFSRKYISKEVSILFFDVTTLYYESFKQDAFRKNGFSKDNKSNQPQIVISLVVTETGFPLKFKVFEGNKFEGHTMIPVIKELIKTQNLNDCVVVADAAMLSGENIKNLENENIKFIVGARLGNLNRNLFDKITSDAFMLKTDGQTKRIMHKNNLSLIISYSTKRAQKDKSDREKQIKKAITALKNPANVTRNYKFLAKDKLTLNLNQSLIQKQEKLDGLKGYVTNANYLTNAEVIKKYSELWQVEKSFRISKSDLKARPIFHTTKQKILTHILIVFTSLAITRYAELKNLKSVKKMISVLSQVKEIKITDRVTGNSTHSYTNPQKPQILNQLLQDTNLNWGT